MWPPTTGPTEYSRRHSARLCSDDDGCSEAGFRGPAVAVLGLGVSAVAHFSSSTSTSPIARTSLLVHQLLVLYKEPSTFHRRRQRLPKVSPAVRLRQLQRKRQRPPCCRQQFKEGVKRKESAAAPTPQYELGLRVGNQPPGLPFANAGAEPEAKFQGVAD